MIKMHRRAALAALAACALAAPLAQAADPYPAKPIQLVLPFPPGGSFDPIFRTLAEAASKDLGQPIVLMHKPGAGGVTGTASLATLHEADGYTIAVMHNSVIRAPLVQKVTWDPLKDFTYLIGLAGLTTGIVVATDAPWKSLPELLADAKKRPGAVSWGNQHQPHLRRAAREDGGHLLQPGALQGRQRGVPGGDRAPPRRLRRPRLRAPGPGRQGAPARHLHRGAAEALRRADRERAGS
jgi:hypothetical protein